MNCLQFKTMSDSYIGDELLVETNHEVLRHLENCASCRNELAAQRELRSRLRVAVMSDLQAQPNPVFVRRLEAVLRQTALRPTLWEKLKAGTFISSPAFAAAIAACLVVGVLFGAILSRQSPASEAAVVRQNQTSEPAKITQPAESDSAQVVNAAWREMTHSAVGDHENCALHFRLKETPIPLDQAAVKYGKFNKGLDKTVTAALQNVVFTGSESGKTKGRLKMIHAHSCIFEGRRFAHIIFKNGEKMISILVAENDLPAASDDTINSRSEDSFRTASFLAAHHAVFVVSDLSEQENMIVAQAIAPAVSRHIEQSEV